MPGRSTFQSLARMAIGAALVTLDGLSRRIDTWEAEIESNAGAQPSIPAARSSPGAAVVTLVPPAEAASYPALATEITAPDSAAAPDPAQPSNAPGATAYRLALSAAAGQAGELASIAAVPAADRRISLAEPPPDADTSTDLATYALVGLLFHGQERLLEYGEIADRATRLLGKWGELLAGPVYRSVLMRPLRRGVDDLSAAGQERLERWIERGRRETAYSRSLVQTAVSERVDHAIDYLTANEEVQELVQSQSAGLVDEVIEETRERTVSADNLLEAMVRSFFRRPPRWELPEPPPELKAQAEEHTRLYPGRAAHK